MSYTELEFDTATEAGLDRLVFLLDTGAADVGIPLSALIDLDFGGRQEAFRRRVRDSGLTTASFASPAELGQLVERSLQELAGTWRRTGSQIQGGQTPAMVVVGEIPQEPLGFQPRAELLAALDAPGPGSRVTVVQAVTGMRGVGKTHLAAAYARARLAEHWRVVAWVNAEDAGGVLAALATVAVGMGLGAGEGDADSAGRAVRHRLEIDGDRCLLVFDNATDPAVLQPFIPATGAARVIITSNQQSMANLGAGVPVDVFSESEALTYLAERTSLADAEGAQAVAVELGYLPLALAQASAVIADQHLGYGTYLERLRAMPVGELLRPVEAGQYPRGVAAAVLLSLEGVRAGDDTGACTAVLELAAVLSPGGIYRALMHAAGRQGVLGRAGQAGNLAPEVVDRALGRLAGASLLTFSVDDSSVSAHRIVTRVIREQLATGNSLAAVCTAAAQLLEGLAEPLRRTWHERRGDVRDLVEQIMALYESSSGCPADHTLVHRMIRLRLWAVWSLNRLGDSAAQSILIAEPLLVGQERLLGAEHPDALAARNELAEAYRGAGRTAEAIVLFDQNLTVRERVLGADHPDTLLSRSNLASAYRGAGRTAEAITLHEQTLTDRERVLGADHPETLFSRNNLALAYQDAGRTAEAISLLEQNLTDRERVLGADRPETLASRNNLANAYREAGRTAEAITLFEQNLTDRERVLGADHPQTLRTRSHLAAAYGEAGRTAEAITLFEQTLTDQERVLGADHPDTLITRNNLAAVCQAAGRATGAIEPEPSDPKNGD
jgi:tetratricopeptide (TPR) repeat protein